MKAILTRLNACQAAIDWVGDKTPEEAWEQCHRGDWMLWFYARKYPENIRELTLAKGHCANTVRPLMKDIRSIAAVDAAINYGLGKMTDLELKLAADAAADAAAYTADYAAAADAAAYAAADAADAAANADYEAAYAAAADAADAAAYADYAAADAAYVVDYADYAAADADYVAANADYAANQRQTADICRKYLKLRDIMSSDEVAEKLALLKPHKLPWEV